jgi:hypothetical protein
MTPTKAWETAAQWGSLIRAGDPGACMYGFNEKGLVQSEAHRAACLDWIDRECLPGSNKRDTRQLTALRAYLATAAVSS